MAQAEFSSAEQDETGSPNDRGRLGHIPTNEELMIALDTAELAK